MKYIRVVYTGDWSTSLEVPDDFALNAENLAKLVEDNEDDFDFLDGGATWFFEEGVFEDEDGIEIKD